MKDTIFVSVATYRDRVCSDTLKSLYTNARHPLNVFVGVCQQNDVSDDDCIDVGLKDHPEFRQNVRVLRLAHYQARGPTYARFLCSTLYDNEEYFLQIDSHCKFVKDWDVLLIKMIQDLKAHGVNKPCLSHYTPNYTDYQAEPDPKSPISTICKAWLTDTNLISLEGAGWVQPDDLPRPNAYIAAGMFFCEGKFIKEIPFDPELDFLFIGEELLLSARFFTHGWDIFTPNKNTIYHLYTREGEPKFWENQNIEADAASQKARYILGLDTDKSKLTPRQIHLLDRYGLGKERTLEEYYQFAGIDLQKKEVIKNMCENNQLRVEKNLSASTPEEQPPILNDEQRLIGPPEEKKKKPKRRTSQTIFNVCSVLVFMLLMMVVGWGAYTLWMDNKNYLKRSFVSHPPAMPPSQKRKMFY